MNNFYLEDKYFNMLIDIFNNYCPNATIYAYGSRIKNEAQQFSDVDLSIKNFNDENCNINELKNIINKSNLPYIVDINLFDNMPDYMQKEILKNNIIIFGK